MNNDEMKLQSFSMPMEITLTKSSKGEDGEWSIEGLASTNSLDQQNEVVLVKGLDLSYLESGKGTFNWNHRGDADPSSIVGIITESKRTPNNELFIKGKLLKSLPKAKHVYNLLKALATDAPERKMGMSIEGKVLSRNGNQIVKAWVKAVALTLDPVNKDTWVSFAKSMESAEWLKDDPITDMGVDEVEKSFTAYSTMSDMRDSESTVPKCSGCGNYAPPKRWRDGKMFCANCVGAGKHVETAPAGDMEKTLTTTGGTSAGASNALGTIRNTSPLIPESLDKKLKDQGYASGKNAGKKKKGRKAKKRKAVGEKISKSYSYDEAVDRLIQLAPALTRVAAERIVEFTLKRLEQE